MAPSRRIETYRYRICPVPLFLLLLMLLTAAGSAMAQEQAHSHTHTRLIDLRSGVRDFASVDRVASPLVYTDTQLPVSLAYTARADGRFWRAELAFASGTAGASSGNVREVTTLDIGVERQFRLNAADRTVALFAGPRLSLNSQEEDPVFESDFFGTIREEGAGYLSASLGLAAMAEWRIDGRHTLRYLQNLPLAAWMIRPGYALSGSDDGDSGTVGEVIDDGSFTAIGELFELQAGLNLRRDLGKRSSLTLGLSIHYLTFPEPFRGRFSSGNFLIGYGYRL